MKDYNNIGVLPQNDSPKRSGNACLSCWCWFLQIFVLVSLIGGLVYFFLYTEPPSSHDDEYEQFIPFAPFAVLYILFIISECCSPTFKYLSNQNENDQIYKVMGKLFNTAPVITWTAQCYHYETRHYTETDSQGNTHDRTETVRVNTHYEEENLQYYSFRDVSGTFLLDIDRAAMNKKAYIKLHLSKSINFADAISYADYKSQKDRFYERNRHRDDYMDFNEYEKIPGLKTHNLVKIGNKEPCCFGLCSYIFWTLIPFCQFYKLYVNSFCVFQPFKIRKIISTRYNLMAEDNTQKYLAAAPCINLGAQSYQYTSAEVGCVYESAKVNLPTEEELRNAQQYQSKVPDFSINCVGGEIIQKPVDIIDTQPRQSFLATLDDDPAILAANDIGNNQIEDNTDSNTFSILPSDKDSNSESKDTVLNVYPSANEKQQ